jgi:hypothetical protein
MLDGSRPPICAFTLECGIDQAPDDPSDNEGGVHPDYSTKFPKIEREVQRGRDYIAAGEISISSNMETLVDDQIRGRLNFSACAA